MKKQAQVTIFVIIAIIMVALIALFFVFRIEKIPFVSEKPETNLKAFMSSCIEDNMKENINIVLSQGGFIEPLNYHMFNDFTVTYLCYTNTGFEACVNQHPMLLREISNELKGHITPTVEECFTEFEKSLEKQGYEIETGESMEVDVSLVPGKIYLDTIRDITITKAEEVSSFKEMRLTYLSSLYDLANIAVQIANEESTYCYFERVGFMNLNQNYLISLKMMSDSTKIYTIQDKKTGDEMNIAIKGCITSV